MRGFSKVFSFTFLRQMKSKAYQLVTLLGILILFLVPFLLLPIIEEDAGTPPSLPDLGGEAISEYDPDASQSDIKDIFFVNASQSYQGNLAKPLEELLATEGYANAVIKEAGSYPEALTEAGKDPYSLVLVMEEIQDSSTYGFSIVLPDNSMLSIDHAGMVSDTVSNYAYALELEGYGLSADRVDNISLKPSAGFAASKDQTSAGDASTNGTEADGTNPEVPGDNQAIAEDEDATFLMEIFGFVLPYVNIMLIYFLVLYYGQGVAQNCIMEKSSKLMDNFLVSVQPKAMLLGKVLGCAFSAIFQFSLWIGALILGFNLGLKRAYAIHPEPMSAPIAVIKALGFGKLNLPISRILVACLLIFAGFLLYCSIAAIGGSLASKQEELGTTNIIFTTFLIISFFICLSKGFLQADQMPSMGILDFIPFTSLMITPARVVMGVVPIPYALLSLAILLITSLLILAFAGKLYKLLTFYKGNIPKPREIWKLMTEKN